MSDAPDPHEAAQAQFSDFLDGELGEQDKAAVEQHLAGCARCRGELDTLKSTLAALHGARKGDTPSPEFMSTLRDQIRTRSRGRFFGDRRRSYKLELVSAVTLVIAVGIYVILRLASPLLFVR